MECNPRGLFSDPPATAKLDFVTAETLYPTGADRRRSRLGSPARLWCNVVSDPLSMKTVRFLLCAFFCWQGVALGADPTATPSLEQASTLSSPATALSEARRNFHSKLLPPAAPDREPVEPAPKKLFLTTKYPAPAGKFAAYLSPDPKDGKRHPAIVWITGGDCNSTGDVWSPAPRDNDQTAAAYRKAGIVMMFPSLRGGNDNPGTKEGFLGEVDDVLAAADFLARQPYVDPARIYLGGHSTGGTLALLVAESSNRFRGVFAFGPAAEARDYGVHNKFVPADLSLPQENKLRSPIAWLADIQTPTWVLEGTEGNIDALRDLAKASTNVQVHFVTIQGATHFATLAPTNELLAKKIVQDTGAPGGSSLTEEEVNRLFAPK